MRKTQLLSANKIRTILTIFLVLRDVTVFGNRVFIQEILKP